MEVTFFLCFLPGIIAQKIPRMIILISTPAEAASASFRMSNASLSEFTLMTICADDADYSVTMFDVDIAKA